MTDEAEGGCPFCGRKLQSETRGRSVVVYCDGCGWAAATSNLRTIDHAQYDVYVDGPASLDATTLVGIAGLAEQNAMAIRRRLEVGPLLVASGYDYEIRPVCRALTDLGVDFRLESRREPTDDPSF